MLPQIDRQFFASFQIIYFSCLSVKWAVDKIARACMERMIGYITGIKKTQVWQEKATKPKYENKFSGSS
jgi:hypothetical protein